MAEQITRVSMKTPKVCTNPCFAGWDTVAAADAMDPPPIPASLENNPLATPLEMAAPIPPPITCSIPKAFLIIKEIIPGIASKFVTMRKIASRM